VLKLLSALLVACLSAVPGAQVMILGHVLVIDPSCGIRERDIRCDAVNLSWTIAPGDELDTLREATRQKWLAMARADKLEIFDDGHGACRVLGSAGQCRMLSAGPQRMLVGTAVVGGQGVRITCTFVGGPMESPPPCDQVIGL
jgi:hypothetical protein